MECERAKAICVSITQSHGIPADTINSRTYGEDTGEDIREGFEPPDNVAAADPNGEDEPFIVRDDQEEHSGADSEESRQWQQAIPTVLLKPKYGLDGEAFENVWGGEEPAQSPRENP